MRNSDFGLFVFFPSMCRKHRLTQLPGNLLFKKKKKKSYKCKICTSSYAQHCHLNWVSQVHWVSSVLSSIGKLIALMKKFERVKFWTLPAKSGYMKMCNSKGCGQLWDEEESEEEGLHRRSSQATWCFQNWENTGVNLDHFTFFSFWEWSMFLWRCTETKEKMEVETRETMTSWYSAYSLFNSSALLCCIIQW